MPPTWSLHDQTAGVVLGTYPSRIEGDAAVGGVDADHTWELWEWDDSSSETGVVADRGIGAFPILKGSYRVEYVERPASPAEHRRHITGIDTVALDGTKRHWSDIALVRDALADGDEFYTQRATSDRHSLIESYDCLCGVETIRSCLDPPAGQNLDNVGPRPLSG